MHNSCKGIKSDSGQSNSKPIEPIITSNKFEIQFLPCLRYGWLFQPSMNVEFLPLVRERTFILQKRKQKGIRFILISHCDYAKSLQPFFNGHFSESQYVSCSSFYQIYLSFRFEQRTMNLIFAIFQKESTVQLNLQIFLYLM